MCHTINDTGLLAISKVCGCAGSVVLYEVDKRRLSLTSPCGGQAYCLGLPVEGEALGVVPEHL